MTEPRLYSVVFAGRLLADADPEQVKEELARRFRLGSQQLARLFCGAEVAVRRDLSLTQAQALRQAFLAAGADCVVRPQDEPSGVPALTEEVLARAFARTVTPDKPSRAERLKRALAAWAALLVPGLYPLALLVLALFALVRIARPVLDPERGVAAALLLDALPAALAALVLIWLARPLLWRRRSWTLTPRPEQAPLLHDLVGRIAAQAGVPAPDLVLDDQPRLRACWRWRQRRPRLSLRIGLPVLAALDTQQLAGLLAAELSAAASLETALPQQWLREGLTRCHDGARRRDALDTALQEWLARQDGWRRAVGVRLAAALRLPHRLLERLAALGERVAEPLLRPLERAAREWQWQVSGRAAAERAACRLQVVAEAWERLAPELLAADGRELLSADLPGLLAWLADLAQAETLEVGDAEQPTPDEPSFTLRAPAAALLADYPAVARELSLRTYRRLGLTVGDADLVAPAAAEAALMARRRAAAALETYFREYRWAGQVIVPAGIERARRLSKTERLAELEAVVAELRRAVPDMDRLRKHYLAAAEALREAEVAVAVAQHRPSPRAEAVYRERREVMTARDNERKRLDELFARRLGLGLAEALARAAAPKALAAELAAIGTALAGLAALQPDLQICQRELRRVRALMAAKGPTGRLPEYAFMAHMSEAWHRLERIAERLAEIRVGDASLSERIGARLMPPASNASAAALAHYLERLDAQLERYRQRLMGRLAELAEEIERAEDIRIKRLA